MITIEQAKAHLRVEHGEEDSLITSLIASAFRHIENRTGQVFDSRDGIVMLADRLPQGSCGLELQWTPVRAVTEVSYLDPDGVRTVLESGALDVDKRGVYPVLYPAIDTSWPNHRPQRSSVQITVNAGWEQCPADVSAAALLIIGHLYEHRESVVVGTISSELPMGVEMLLAPYVIHRIG
ncbi:MAG TPA: head-tail connector protein [Marinobacter sp.]|uniref:head-tail connector protein n=1 Tax=Marinobacter sp. TaxID=50741 RepID=UPI002D806B20|nr:head-tail connector protein [Marinobacter sp.]HET8799628.1 head-tail connector protein [Marinobacter sp.]